MFTVRRDERGYSISTGDRHPAYAPTFEAVQQALIHYYGAGACDKAVCAFCLQIAQRKS